MWWQGISDTLPPFSGAASRGIAAHSSRPPSGQDRSDASKRVSHDAQQRAIAQTKDRVSRQASEKLAHLFAREHRRLASLDGMFRPPDIGRRIHREELAEDHPIEEHSDRRQVLLHGRPRASPAGVLHPRRDMDRFHLGQLFHPLPAAPGKGLADGAVVGAPGIRIRDLRG